MYNGERMLIGANKLNNKVKRYLEASSEYSLEDVRADLGEFKLDLEEYIADITPYNFTMPRSDNLTKEGILVDLQLNLNEVNNKLANRQQGGRRKHKSIKNKRKGKKHTVRRKRVKRQRR
jgi:hypothetical protein